MKDTVWLDGETNSLCYIDQRKLPENEVIKTATDARAVWEAIRTLAIRGAPAIGVGAALGLYAAATRFEDTTVRGFVYSLTKTAEMLCSARPTAVNLAAALERMVNAVNRAPEEADVSELLEILLKESVAIRDGEVAASRAIGEHGLELLRDGMTILTHCNAGALATVKYGTALAPIHLGRERGIHFKVFADETRPLLQGARLTAYELARDGIPVTVICEGAAASLLAAGKIDAILVGCDRCAANGDAANKIGTLPLAIAASHYNVPFYVCMPFSTFDPNTPDGAHITIEERDGAEVWDRHIKGVSAWNPAFDVTPHSLITAYITEKGILHGFDC